MTKISYIAGVGAAEGAQRAAFVPKQPFIPYLSMTKGEMHLALMLEQAQILAGFYGSPKYKEAEAMLENTLYGGVHGSGLYLGVYGAELRGVAQAIARAKRQTAPAAGAILGRQSMMSGIHIGEVIPVQERLKACQEAAKKLPGAQKVTAIAKCMRAAKIENILNDGLENCGQYLANGFLPKNNKLPQNANLKIFNQELAQQDISRVGKFDLALTQQWLNTGMMRKNAEVAKIKPLGWIDTNAALTMLPEAAQQEIIQLFQKARPGTSAAQLGSQLAAIVNKYQPVNGIGDPVSVTIAIIGAITALIGSISEFAKRLKVEAQDAFAQVNGFGARVFGPEEGDWLTAGGGTGQPPSTGAGTDYTTPLLLGGGALLAYALLK